MAMTICLRSGFLEVPSRPKIHHQSNSNCDDHIALTNERMEHDERLVEGDLFLWTFHLHHPRDMLLVLIY